jgi:NAD(P)-dependent dehydrogenase (short-subunit alcohol dehydrogenase family)
LARLLKIRGEEAGITVELGEGPTAEALWEALPIESRASLWGEEIYFPISLSSYNASKHGLVGLTRTLAAEWGGRGVRVNAVCPGWVRTEMEREGALGAALAARHVVLFGGSRHLRRGCTPGAERSHHRAIVSAQEQYVSSVLQLVARR